MCYNDYIVERKQRDSGRIVLLFNRQGMLHYRYGIFEDFYWGDPVLLVRFVCIGFNSILFEYTRVSIGAACAIGAVLNKPQVGTSKDYVTR